MKKTNTGGEYESFRIYSSSILLYTSPKFNERVLTKLDICLPSNEYNVYNITMSSTMTSPWIADGWIELYGVNGNLILKTVKATVGDESYLFSLYAPIGKGDAWKYAGSLQNGWREYSFADDSWVDASPTIHASGTQYFRRRFVGAPNMASIEAQFRYSDGVVAYINGVEIYRDNMPEGEPTEGTAATKSYGTSDYRGVIRSSEVAEAAESVLAVEVHFKTSHQDAIDFDVLLVYGAGIGEHNQCSVVTLEYTATGLSTAEAARDYNIRSQAVFPKDGFDFLFFYLKGAVRPFVNGIRLFTEGGVSRKGFEFAGGYGYHSSKWKPLISANWVYGSNGWIQLVAATEPQWYQILRLNTTDLKLSETQLLVCNKNGAIVYPEPLYTAQAKYKSISASTNTFGIHDCTVEPALPSGLRLNPENCNIGGSSTVGLPPTTYTVTAQSPYGTVKGQTTIAFEACDGVRVAFSIYIWRYSEPLGFTVRDSATQEVLVDFPTGQQLPIEKGQAFELCLSSKAFEVSISSSWKVWPDRSILNIVKVGNGAKFKSVRYNALQKDPTLFHFRNYIIDDYETWYYKMGVLPPNWMDDDFTGWETGNRYTYPETPNQMQLFKKTFEVEKLNEVTAVFLHIRSKFGSVVYINGYEVWRGYVFGNLTMDTFGTIGKYEHDARVVVPTVIIPKNRGDMPIRYLREGTNVLAIATVKDKIGTVEYGRFDTLVRLLIEPSESHGSSTSVATNVKRPPVERKEILLECKECGDWYIEMGKEGSTDYASWVSSLEIQSWYEDYGYNIDSFDLYARVYEKDEWTLIKRVRNLEWHEKAERKRFYFVNPYTYRQFRLDHINNQTSSECHWILQSMHFYSDNVVAVKPLNYTQSITLYKGLEMVEVNPGGEGYADFIVKPSLPKGLYLDDVTGSIRGTPEQVTSLQTYSVECYKITGEKDVVTFSMKVVYCEGYKGMVSVRIHADANKENNGWYLYEGRGIGGKLLRFVESFPTRNVYYCLDRGIYTFAGVERTGSGWMDGSGYTITVDYNQLDIEVEEVPSSDSEVTVSTTFSTYLPFQFDISTWKVYQGSSYPSSWKERNYDDSTWKSVKAKDIINGKMVTTFIRKSFSLESIDDYQVLNVRMKYAGGVVVYMNGVRVARFNLAEDHDIWSESLIHKGAIVSKFHIILEAVGIQAGENVIAFEVHRPVGVTSDLVFFDATGVFGVSACSTVVDSYSSASSSPLVSGSVEDMLDLDSFTMGTLAGHEETFIEWAVENLEGSRWNQLNILGSTTFNDRIFEVRGWSEESNDGISLLWTDEQSVLSHVKPNIMVPKGMVGYARFRITMPDTDFDPFVIHSVSTAFCKTKNIACPTMDGFVSVESGDQATAPCPEGYSGYLYRDCLESGWSEVRKDRCVMRIPALVRYEKETYVFIRRQVSSTGVPLYVNHVDRWYLSGDGTLPSGLRLDTESGEISGVVSEENEMKNVTVCAMNRRGRRCTSVGIRVRKESCKAEGVWEETEVDDEARYDCRKIGYHFGTQRRRCILDGNNGVWGSVKGRCIATKTVVIGVVSVVVVVGIVVGVMARVQIRRHPSRHVLKRAHSCVCLSLDTTIGFK